MSRLLPFFVLCVLALASLVACDGQSSAPTGPTFTVANNTGPVTINAPIGDGSAGGSAPCAAVGTKQENGPNQPVAGSASCSSVQLPPLQTTEPGAVEPPA